MATNWLADTNTKLGCKFEDAAASGTVADGSTFANNGTVTNNTSVTQGVTGKYTNGIQFANGNNARASFGSAASLDNITQISVCVWLNNSSYGTAAIQASGAYIYGKGYRSGGLYFQSTNQLRWAEHNSFGTATFDTTNGSTTTTGFQHYAVVYNRTTGATLYSGPTIYVAGVQQTVVNSGTDITGGGARDDDSANNLIIGSDENDSGELNSIMDELLVYNGLLNSTNVNEVMDSGIDGSQSSGVNVTFSASRLSIVSRLKTPIFANASSISFYNRFKANLMKGYVDFGGSGSHGIKCGLLTTAYTFNPDDTYWNNLASLYEASGTGYTAGGVSLSNFYIATSSGNQYAYFTCDAARWNNSSFSARYAIFYDTTLVNKDLIMCIDLSRTYTTTNSSLLLNFPSNGLILII